MDALLFYVLAALTAVSAVAVVITQNIVRAATWLLFALAGTAGIFFLLRADFIGATQLLIYVGGTLVLVVFGVMLTAQGPFINMRIGAVEWVVGMGVGLGLYAVLAVVLVNAKVPRELELPPEKAAGTTEEGAPKKKGPRDLAPSKHLGQALLGDRRSQPTAPVPHLPPDSIRDRRVNTYLLPFEIVSVHLLVVLVGAAYLARTKRRRGDNA